MRAAVKRILSICMGPKARWLFISVHRILAVTFFLSCVSARSSYVNFEGKQTNPMRPSPDGTRLFVVNTADARLSVFDITHPLNPFLIAEIPVGIEPVSVNAVNNDEAWV